MTRTCAFVDHHNVERCTECNTTLDLCLCPDVNHLAQERLSSDDGFMIRAIRGELASARLEFPNTRHMLTALTEEVGELSKAMMEHDRGLGVSAQEIFREAIQVAAMAIRVGTEGDDDFEYNPESILRE